MNSIVTLEQALHMEYRFNVTAQAEGGFVIQFPDLPGCMTQVANITEVSVAAEEIRTLWLETADELGQKLPAPVYPEEFSGKFNVRIPRSLHRELAYEAAEEGVSLNQFVVSILANRAAWPHAFQHDAETQETSKPPVRTEEWRPITELPEVEIELSEHRETALGKRAYQPAATDQFGSKTTITKNKIVPFGPRRQVRQNGDDDDIIERAI